MDNLRFYGLVNSISVISGRWVADNEMLCAMQPRTKRFQHPPSLEPGTARSAKLNVSLISTEMHTVELQWLEH